MPHLTLEEIARLVDEAPNANEAAHLESCDRCRQELDDMRADAAALAALPAIEPPATEWSAIEARLAHEGLFRVPRARTFSWSTAMLRLAASIALFALGTLSGVAWTRAQQPERAVTAQANLQEPAATRALVQEPALPPTNEAIAAVPVEQRERDPVEREPVAAPTVQAATSLVSAREPRSAEEAARLLREVEALYFQALVRLADAAPATESGDALTRLAVLEGITTLTGTALGQAPADPVLNGYHLAALAQREATLKQIATRTTDSWF